MITDIPDLLVWNADGSAKDLLLWAGPVFRHPLTEQQVRDYLSSKGSNELYSIEVDGRSVGIIELGSINQLHRNARISKVLIGDKQYRGRGVASKAIQEILKIGFQKKRLHKVSLGVLSGNTPALRCYYRNGFVQEGVSREQRSVDGQWYDLIEMGLMARDWFASHSAVPRRSYKTERLIVRSAVLSDVQEAVDYYRRNKDFLAAYSPRRPEEFFTVSFHEQMIMQDVRHEQNGDGIRLWIERRDDPGRFIGNMSLSQMIRGVFCSCYIGYQLDKDELRQGYMTEALRVMIDVGFREFGMHRIEANIMPENTASRATVERLGFRQEGLAKAYLRLDGVWRDHLHYALLNDEWREI